MCRKDDHGLSDTDTELALGGDLYSNRSGPPESSITYQFTNSLGIPTLLFIIEADGEHSGGIS